MINLFKRIIGLTAVLGIAATAQAIPSIQVGDLLFTLTDATYFDIPRNLLQPDIDPGPGVVPQNAPTFAGYAGTGKSAGAISSSSSDIGLTGGKRS